MAMMTVRLTIIMTCLFALWLQPLQAAAGERKVAVVMPEAQQERWERTAQWALAGIDAAQTGLDRQVRLAIEWHDEDAADLQTWLQQVAKDESYAAVIGPTTSTAARTAASTLNASKKTLILPIATSTELQRIYAASPNVFNLTESDFTQCYLMMAGFLLDGKQKVSLLTSNDVYGQSFIDWFGYSAEELGLTVGMLGVYRNEAELRDYIRQWDGGTLLFAPGTEDDAVIFDQMVTQTDSVYSHLRLAAVGVEDAHAEVGPSGRRDVYHSVGARAEMAVGEPLRELGGVFGDLAEDVEIVVAEAVHFRKAHGGVSFHGERQSSESLRSKRSLRGSEGIFVG